MELLEKKEYLNELFSMYQELFTEKQKGYFKMYYFEDYSLQEIAGEFKVSRNAVFDQLKHIENNLNTYEQKLGLLKSRDERIELLDKLEKSKDFSIIDKIRKMDE